MRRLCLGLAIAVVAALVPRVSVADDNEIARHIMNQLKVEQQRGNLRGFHVDMRVDRGTVWFEGFVANREQEQLILRTAQEAGSMGVVQVVDDIDIRAAEAVAPVPQDNMGTQPALPVSWTQDVGSSAQPTPQAMPNVQVPQRLATMPTTPMASGHRGPAGITADNPQLPGYAWPGYAAHPNYAAVTYPRQYSPTAWPYIGPFYPYPQVPLGWRKVTLEWDDGWWQLDFNDR